MSIHPLLRIAAALFGIALVLLASVFLSPRMQDSHGGILYVLVSTTLGLISVVCASLGWFLLWSRNRSQSRH